MATLYRRGKSWYLNVSVDGKPRRRSLGTNERLARMRLAEVVAEIERGRAGFAVEKPITLRERIDLWLETHRANVAPSTYLRCQLYADTALALLDGARVLAPAELERYKARRLDSGVKAKTVNNELAWLKQIHGARGDHPFRAVRPLKIRDSRPVRWLTTDEVARLLAAARPRVRPYLLGYLYTGARREELVNVAWSDWDRARGTLRLASPKTAGSGVGDRTIPVHPRLLAVLNAQEALGLAQPWPRPSSLHQLLKWLVTASGRAGLAPVPRLHDLRHTFASHLVQAGVSLYVVGKLLGHTNPSTTAIYAHLSPETFDQAVGLLRY